MVRVARERRAQRKGLEPLDVEFAGVALVLADVVRDTGSHRACWQPRARVAFVLTRFFRHRRFPHGATASARQRAQPKRSLHSQLERGLLSVPRQRPRSSGRACDALHARRRGEPPAGADGFCLRPAPE